MRELNFFMYRYSLVPSLQITFEQNSVKDKKILFKNIFLDLVKNTKLKKNLNNREYILYFRHRISENIFFCKFARQTFKNTHNPGNADIEEKKESDYPYIYLIVDTERQIFYIQNKTSVFISITDTLTKLKKFFEFYLSPKDFYLKTEAMTDDTTFWGYIEKSSKIYELKLNMKSPNAFDGILNAEKLLKKIRQYFNNTELDLNLRNEEGQLQILKENISDFIKYIQEGCGQWELLALDKESKKKYNVKSNDEMHIRKLHLPSDIDDVLDDTSVDTDISRRKDDIKGKVIYIKDILGDTKYGKNKESHKK